MKYLIKVTEEDIKDAEHCYSNCPVARACRRVISPNVVGVSYQNSDRYTLGIKIGKFDYLSIPLPKDACKRINRYDSLMNEHMDPFEFEVEINDTPGPVETIGN